MVFWLSSVRRGSVVQRLVALFDSSWAVWRGFASEDSGFSYSFGVAGFSSAFGVCEARGVLFDLHVTLTVRRAGFS